jgi:enoyl-CoA hydratase
MLNPRHAMELHIAGRVYSGEEAERVGLVNQAFPGGELPARVLEIAETIAQTPPAVVAVNKRFVHSAMEAQGARAIVRTAADLQNGPHLQALGAGGADLAALVKGAQGSPGDGPEEG